MTLTMNPALDITTDTDRVIHTDKMRCGLPRYDPGGGGINVARIAHVLGASVTALFPAGGHAGDKVTDLVADSGVAVQRITVARSTRESFTVDERSTGNQYRFVLPGPQLTDAEQTECLEKLWPQQVPQNSSWRAAACRQGCLPTSISGSPTSVASAVRC